MRPLDRHCEEAEPTKQSTQPLTGRSLDCFAPLAMTDRRNNVVRMSAFVAIALVLLVLALPLTACGKKGEPVAPPDQPNVYPQRTYPHE